LAKLFVESDMASDAAMDPTILVTGATGFLGGAAAAQLLQRPRIGKVFLLVRGATAAAARERAQRSLARFGAIPDQAWQRCEVLAGDLHEPSSLADPRLDQVTHVLHTAGDTSLRSVRRVRDTNIAGTLALARLTGQAPRLVRFLHVGTAYICGAEPPALVHEDDYPAPTARHLVEYTRSKAECEQLLTSSLPDLPLVIARPSVIVGHTRLGCGPSASIFWYYRTVDLLRRVPAPLDARKDIVPVDYAAEALLFLLFHQPLRWRRYHISAGEGASVTWREMAAVFSRYHGERPEDPYELADFPRLVRERARLRPLLGPGDDDLLLRALEPFFLLSASGAEMFDNSRLLSEGMRPPPRFTEYLPACLAQSVNRSVYEQILHDEWASGVPALPWQCGEPLTAERHRLLLRRTVFECCKWNTQVQGRPLICPFPLILEGSAWDQIGRLASELARETLTAERELLQRPDLHAQLGIPRAVRRCLPVAPGSSGTPDELRVLRFDFHWTLDGWRISEANTDVAGGFIEASGVTQLLADCYPGCHASGDPAGVLSEALHRRCGTDGRVGLLHLSVYSEDLQTMLYLARRLEGHGQRPCLLSPAQLRWRAGSFEAVCDWDRGPLHMLFRFLPAEWLPHMLPAATRQRLFADGRTLLCNPGHAILTQSKRFSLMWDRLETPLPTWRSLLPETRSPADVSDLESGHWVLKPALGHEGHQVRLRPITAPEDWRYLVRSVRKHPDGWAAQRCFDAIPLPTPEGLMYPCLGVYVIDGRVAGCYGRLATQPLIDDQSREVAVLVRAAPTSVRKRGRGS
jgi:nucleoside-diphosphate-sugar epimerase/glutathionylspermidine synthase